MEISLFFLTLAQQVVEDLNLMATVDGNQPDETALLHCWKSFVAQSAPALDYDYRQLYGQLQGRVCGTCDRSTPPQQQQLMDTWLRQCPNALVSYLQPGSAIERALASKDDQLSPDVQSSDQFFSSIHRLVSRSAKAAALSAARGEMSLWDFDSGRCDKGIAIDQSINTSIDNMLMLSVMLSCCKCCRICTSR